MDVILLHLKLNQPLFSSPSLFSTQKTRLPCLGWPNYCYRHSNIINHDWHLAMIKNRVSTRLLLIWSHMDNFTD